MNDDRDMPEPGDRKRACRQMLRHLSHPRILRNNDVVKTILRASGASLETCSDAELVALAGSAVEATLAALTPRQQTIVRRCDIGGERYADVARSLFMSERHAFRERSAAIVRILDLIVRRPLARIEPAAGPSSLRLALAHAQALDQNGNWEAAARHLEQIAADVADDDRRAYVDLRISRIYANAQELAAARERLEAARRLVQRATDPSAWQRAEFDVAAARFAEAVGESDESQRLVRRCRAHLRSALDRSNDDRIRDALVDALTLQTESAMGRGDLDDAVRAGQEAVAAIGESRTVDPQLIVAARLAAAMADLVAAKDPQRCERELIACYRFATASGLTREAMGVVVHLAGCLRLTQRAADAVTLLTPLLPTARVVGNGGVLAGFLSELLSANLESGASAAAASYVLELKECARGDIHMNAVADFASARIHLAARNFETALTSAEDAATGFSRVGKPRLAGSALRLQAEALLGLGRRAHATEAIRMSIERLDGRSHPIRIAAAYRVLGALSGDAKHATTARQLLRSVRTPKPE